MRAFLAHLRGDGRAAAARCWSGGTCGRARPGSPPPAGGRSAPRGMTAVGCGVVPTPALALEAARRGAAAVMVTGSHIPFDRNGLKFYRPGGEEITKADEAGHPRRAGRAAGAGGPGAVRVDAGVGARYVARSVDFFGRAASAGSGSASTSTAPRGATHMRRGAGRARGGGGPARAERQLRADRHRGDPARAGGAHPRLGRRAPAGGAGLDRRRRRPAARRRRDRRGAARRRARGAGGAAPRGGRGGGAAERQHGAGAVGLVRPGRCARGSARRTSSRRWRG